MNLAVVCGTAVGTVRGDTMKDARFLLIESAGPDGHGTGDYLVALDAVGARSGDMVMYSQGSSCRWTFDTEDQPVDTLITGIIDAIDDARHRVYQG